MWWTRISCLTEGVCITGLRVSRYRASEEVYSWGSWKIGIESHRVVLQLHVGQVKIREWKVTSQGVMQKFEPHARNPCAPKFEKTSIRFLQEASQGSIKLARKCYLEYSLDTYLSCGEFGEEIFWLQTLRSRKMRQKSMFEDSKEIITPRSGEHFILPIADGTAKLSGRDQGVRESTLTRDQPARSEDLREDLQGNSATSQPLDGKIKDDVEAQNDFWSIEGDFIYRHHLAPRVQLHVTKEETFPIPLKDIWRVQDYVHKFGRVARRPCWWLLERRCGSKFVRLNDRIHEVYTIACNTSKRIHVVREAAQKHPRNYQTWLSVAWNVVRHVKGSSEEEEERMNYRKNQKLDNARKLRDIYFIDPGDGKHKETIKTLGNFLNFDGGGNALQDGNREALKGAPGNCGRFRSINAPHDYSQWEKCRQVRRYRFTFTVLIFSWRCSYSRTRLQFCHQASSAKNTLIPVSSGQTPHLTKNEEKTVPERMSFLLLSRIVIKLERKFVFHIVTAGLIVSVRAQQDCQVTILTLKPRETEAILQKSTKYKEGQHSSNEKSLARPPKVVGGVRR